jgi:hypothetical protein
MLLRFFDAFNERRCYSLDRSANAPRVVADFIRETLCVNAGIAAPFTVCEAHSPVTMPTELSVTY